LHTNISPPTFQRAGKLKYRLSFSFFEKYFLFYLRRSVCACIFVLSNSPNKPGGAAEMQNAMIMTTTEIKSKFYEALRKFDENELPNDDAKMVVTHLYHLVQEESDRLSTLDKKNSSHETFVAQSDAHLDRFEMNQTLRSRGIELEY
jgi:hypothetical protein